MNKYNLAEDTISSDELNDLANWIKSNPQLTKGELTKKFEEEFSKYLGIKHTVFVNSGSSANLLMVYAMLESLKNKNAIIPAVSWITTLSPFIHLGFTPFLCDADKDTLGVDLNHFEDLCKRQKPSIAVIVHVLGHPNKMKELLEICEKYNVVLLEDSCEALGTEYSSKKVGTFGKASSFSFYYGHHISTIEGGIVTTNDTEIYNIMLSIRSHGWSRDLNHNIRAKWATDYDVDEIRELYTFYYPGFNLRSTEINAFLGISQLRKIENIVKKREENFKYYSEKLGTDYYQQLNISNRLSSFAYGTIVKNRLEVFKHLKANGIDSRPLICGSMGLQPFWIKMFGKTSLPIADIVHNNGIYLPNHFNLDKSKIEYICNVFQEVAKKLYF